jgi:hypothetical protein
MVQGDGSRVCHVRHHRLNVARRRVVKFEASAVLVTRRLI